MHQIHKAGTPMPEIDFEPQGWKLDKRINLPTIVSLATTLVIVVSLFTTLSTDMQYVKEDVAQVKCDLKEAQQNALKVVRIEERLRGMETIMVEIKNEVKAARIARK